MSTKRGVNLKVLITGLAIIVPVLVLFAVSFGNDPRAVPSVLEGKPAPTFVLTDLEGQPVSLEQFRGKPVVINFWSTWCGPCKMEHGLLQQTARMNTDVQFLGVIYSDEAAKAKAYLQRAGATYPSLVDPQSTTAIDYGVAGVPETFFIDRSGTIVEKFVGPLDPSNMQRLLQLIRRG